MNTAHQKITIEMTPMQHKRYLAFLEADQITKGLKRALKEFHRARNGEIKIKSAHDLLKEL